MSLRIVTVHSVASNQVVGEIVILFITILWFTKIYSIMILVKYRWCIFMELTKTEKLQIYTTDDDRALLLNSMRAYLDACNYVSHYVYTTKDLS